MTKLILAFGNFCERPEIDHYTFPQIYDVTKYVTLAISVCELNQALYFSFTLPYRRLTDSLVAAFAVSFRLSLFLCTKFWLSLLSPIRHGRVFIPFSEIPFYIFRPQRACGWRMNEYKVNKVLVCVGSALGGYVVLYLLYCSVILTYATGIRIQC
jgi:hypothetical protein